MWVVSGLLLAQVLNGTYSVFLSNVLSTGIRPLFFTGVISVVTVLLLAPLAIVFERKKWPKKMRWNTLVLILLCSLGGVVFQVLLYVGLHKTTAVVASAMSSFMPSLIFIIAASLRLEKVDVTCIYSRAKIFGFLTSLVGVLIMSLTKTSPIPEPAFTHDGSSKTSQDWVLGCTFLLSSVFIFSCMMVSQSVIMEEIPAPISLCATTSCLTAIYTVVFQLIGERKLDVCSCSISIGTVAVDGLVGGIASSGFSSFQTWVIKIRGPVFVAMFSPTATIASAIISAFTMKQFMSWGSFLGTLLIFVGLYLVLWAKDKENELVDAGAKKQVDDIEEPLLG